MHILHILREVTDLYKLLKLHNELGKLRLQRESKKESSNTVERKMPHKMNHITKWTVR